MENKIKVQDIFLEQERAYKLRTTGYMEHTGYKKIIILFLESLQ